LLSIYLNVEGAFYFKIQQFILDERDPTQMYSMVNLQKWVIIVANDSLFAVGTVLAKLRFVATGFQFQLNENPVQ